MSLAAAFRNPIRSMTLERDGLTTVELIVLCQAAHFLTFAAIPLFLPAIRADLQITFTQAGMLSAAGALSYACMQIPAGYLCDRYGSKRLFLIGLTGWCTLSVAFGFVHAFAAGVAIQFVAGAFRALLFAPGLALLASWFPAERRALCGVRVQSGVDVDHTEAVFEFQHRPDGYLVGCR